MYHEIEFRVKGPIDVARPDKVHLERVVFKAGARMRVGIRPHVVERKEGPIEVADLYMEDGSVARNVRFEFFHFLDGSPG